jgi:hypothetical protein
MRGASGMLGWRDGKERKDDEESLREDGGEIG